jgi:hypothetical protein
MEICNGFLLSDFSIVVFPFGFVDHRGHDGHEFIGFLFHGQSVSRGDPTFFAEQFQPKLGFVGLLQRTTDQGPLTRDY